MDGEISRMADALEHVMHIDGLEVVQCRNKFASPSPLGYVDFNLTVRVSLPERRSHLCEIQINHRAILEAKAKQHPLYENVRIKIPIACQKTSADPDLPKKLEAF